LLLAIAEHRRHIVYSQRPERVVQIKLVSIDGNTCECAQQAFACGIDLESMINVTPTRYDSTVLDRNETCRAYLFRVVVRFRQDLRIPSGRFRISAAPFGTWIQSRLGRVNRDLPELPPKSPEQQVTLISKKRFVVARSYQNSA